MLYTLALTAAGTYSVVSESLHGATVLLPKALAPTNSSDPGRRILCREPHFSKAPAPIDKTFSKIYTLVMEQPANACAAMLVALLDT